MPERKWVYIFDAVVLSNFALVKRLDLLIKRYGKEIVVTREVLDEIIAGVVAGHRELSVIEDKTVSGRFRMPKSFAGKRARDTYRELLRILGPGEASCIAYAESVDGVVVTDDKVARGCCADRGLKYTGTIGVLKVCCIKELITLDEADDILAGMISAGYYSPVDRISGIG